MGKTINVLLYPILLEKSLQALGLPANNYSLLGSGTFGHAYLSNGRVYKITTDKSEAIESNKLVGKNNNRIANIFNVKRINNAYSKVPVYLIVLEYLDTKRSKVFKEIQSNLIKIFDQELNEEYIDRHLFDLIYIYRFDPTRYKNEYQEQVYRILDARLREKFYYNSLLQIVDELKTNGIESIDVQYFNLGLKSNGNIAFFDLGMGDENGDVESMEINERIKTYMDNSSAVKVKKSCQLAGKGNTSDACNQGDINNLELTKMNEHTSRWNKMLQRKWKELGNENDISFDEMEEILRDENAISVTEEDVKSVVEYELSNLIKEGITAYHGTPNKFNQFSIDKIGSSDGREVGGWGIYFSDDIGIANDYKSGTGTVMEVELRNGKYFDFDDGLDGDIAHDIITRGLRKGLSNDDIEQFQSDFMDEQYRYDITNKQVYEWLSAVLGSNKAASLYLNSAGYIGNKFHDRTNPDATNYVIFDPSNIKIINSGDEIDESIETYRNVADKSILDVINYIKNIGDQIKPKTGNELSKLVKSYLIASENIERVLKLADNDIDIYNRLLKIKETLNKFGLLRENEINSPNGFDLKTFDSLKSFAARKKYADQKLQKIGTGSSRIVYRMSDGNVLKLASNKKGLDQNNNECGLGQDNYFGELLAKVIDCDQNDLWIVSEEAKKITPQRFQELTDANFDDTTQLILNVHYSRNRMPSRIVKQDQSIVDELYDNSFVSLLLEMMNSYDLGGGDLAKIDSYGEVNRDGVPTVVLIDYGLNQDTWNTHYEKFNKKRNIWEGYFENEMSEAVKVDIVDLPFKSAIEQAGGKIYSVGGAVRDKLLGKESKDLDLLITGIPLDQLEEILKKFGRIDSVGKSFGIIKFNTPETGELDIAIPRTEKKNDAGGYQGFDVTSDHTLPIEKDLERRDFTINAIAKDSSGLMIDPYGGQGDIEKKQIKMVNPQAFSDDPLRMIRAVQFASRFGFTIEPNTMQSIIKNASKIKEISPERILIEFDKIIQKGNPVVGAKLLRQTRLYDNIFGTSRGINIADFKNVKTMGEFIYCLTRNAMTSPSEFYKKNLKGDLDSYNEIRALEIGGQFKGEKKTIFDMYKLHPKSIETNIFGRKFNDLVNYMKSHNIPFSLKEIPVNGNDLMEFGYQGKEIGAAFVVILRKIYAEELPNEREAILNYVKTSR